jgi:hypothetical protein
MLRRMIRWLVALVLALLVGLSLALGGGRPTLVRGAEPTPTPTLPQTNGIPGGGGGGGP